MLRLEHVAFQLGETTILNGISLEIQAGETTGIIGPNGSGKTTLFNCISGFHRISGGKIYFKGENITSLNPARRAHCGLGRVFQNFGIFREMTVGENILTALESRSRDGRLKKRAALAAVEEHLAMVNLAGRTKEKAGSLSGGQLRLLEIARTIAFGAELFLLDEPTAGVSPRMKDEILSALVTLQQLGKTILIIEHDINFIQRLCERIVVLDVGRVMLDGTPDTVRAHPALQEIYFGGASASPARSAA